MPPKEELLTSLKLVQLNDLIQTVAEEAYKGLQSLAASLSGQDDESK